MPHVLPPDNNPLSATLSQYNYAAYSRLFPIIVPNCSKESLEKIVLQIREDLNWLHTTQHAPLSERASIDSELVTRSRSLSAIFAKAFKSDFSISDASLPAELVSFEKDQLDNCKSRLPQLFDFVEGMDQPYQKYFHQLLITLKEDTNFDQFIANLFQDDFIKDRRALLSDDGRLNIDRLRALQQPIIGIFKLISEEVKWLKTQQQQDPNFSSPEISSRIESIANAYVQPFIRLLSKLKF